MLSKNLNEVNLETLYDYQRNYKKELGEEFKKFTFKDQAVIYRKDNEQHLFIECEEFDESNNEIVVLDKGKYISLTSKESELDKGIEKIKSIAKSN